MRPWVAGVAGVVLLVSLTLVGVTLFSHEDGSSSQAVAVSNGSTPGDEAERNFTVAENFTGPRMFRFQIEVPEPTTCEITYEYILEWGDSFQNPPGVVDTIDVNETFQGWWHVYSPSFVQAHVGQHRVAPQHEGYSLADSVKDQGAWKPPNRSDDRQMEGTMTFNVASLYWRPGAQGSGNSSMEITFRCEDPVGEPHVVQNTSRVHLASQDSSTGGVGAGVNYRTVGVNHGDGARFDTTDRPVEVRAGYLCIDGYADGELDLETPEGPQTWELGDREGRGYRYLGPPGSYSYTVDWVNVEGCGWWAAFWPLPQT